MIDEGQQGHEAWFQLRPRAWDRDRVDTGARAETGNSRLLHNSLMEGNAI